MKIGLFFGSFNPIHNGHLIIAQHLLNYSAIEKLWFIVSPHNPLKEKKTLLDDHTRLDMVERAIAKYPNMRASNIEFSLPRPSYTIDTLAYLKEKHPEYSFALIMGEDNLESLPKWKNYKTLIEQNHIIVYPRLYKKESNTEYLSHENISLIQAPIVELSATEIRNMIKENKNVRPMLPPEVFEFLDGSNIYK